MGALYNNELDIVRIGVLQVCVASPKRKYTLITRMPVISGETSLRAVSVGCKGACKFEEGFEGFETQRIPMSAQKSKVRKSARPHPKRPSRHCR